MVLIKTTVECMYSGITLNSYGLIAITCMITFIRILYIFSNALNSS